MDEIDYILKALMLNFRGLISDREACFVIYYSSDKCKKCKEFKKCKKMAEKILSEETKTAEVQR